MTKASRGETRLTRDSMSGDRKWRIRLMLTCLSVVLCIVLAEVGARAFWRLRYHVPVRNPGRILYAFYPELRGVDEELPARDDRFYDVLFLGGSVLHRSWGSVEQELFEQLAYHGHRNVRIFNLAGQAHTSRDSRLKYAALGRARFELVVFYHGINEARANNAPPEVFQQDYSHYGFYEIVNARAPYHGTASFALPYTLRYLTIGFKQRWARVRYVPADRPHTDWVHYGLTPRSAVSFTDNLSAILDLATRRGDRTLLMTFATYGPETDSLEAYKFIDYGLHTVPIEMWGSREHVLNAVDVHNEIVRRLAAEHEDVLFVDQAVLMTGSGRYFNDPCHFTVRGSLQFVEHLLRALLPTLQSGL